MVQGKGRVLVVAGGEFALFSLRRPVEILLKMNLEVDESFTCDAPPGKLRRQFLHIKKERYTMECW